jgi:hypothetical protein
MFEAALQDSQWVAGVENQINNVALYMESLTIVHSENLEFAAV